MFLWIHNVYFHSDLDLPQVDCEYPKANDSQDDESEGRIPSTLLSNRAETGFEKVKLWLKAKWKH